MHKNSIEIRKAKNFTQLEKAHQIAHSSSHIKAVGPDQAQRDINYLHQKLNHKGYATGFRDGGCTLI